MKNSITLSAATAPAASDSCTVPTVAPVPTVLPVADTDTMDEKEPDKVEPQMLGYVRVSTREQNEDRQVIAMREFGVPEDCIHVEKQSGKDFNRPIYQRLVASLRPGDVLVIKSIDRLGRNYDEIIEQWRILTKEKKASIVVIDMPLLDTRTKHDLTGTLVADLVLQLLSYVAETERRFIKQRQAEGIAAAKARGVKFGPTPMEKPEYYPDVLEVYNRGGISQRRAALLLGVSRFTFKKWLDQERHAGQEAVANTERETSERLDQEK